ncbi:MAG: hypothetical protein ACLPVY_14205 [Acidimicrobiia bacterium]
MDLDAASPTHHLSGFDPDDVEGEYGRRHFGELSDDQLFAITAQVVARPKQDPASSFVLHAPLELLARRALLRLVPPDRRDRVRKRMVWVAATYERAGQRMEPVVSRTFESPAAARSALLAATREKDLALVDAAASWLSRHASTDDVMALAPSTVTSLAAAGHASIYFFHLGRTAVGNRAALALLRPLVREVARQSELRIEWIQHEIEACGSDARSFADALARTPRLGFPGSDFIFPTVHQVDSGGQAREVIRASLPPDLAAAGAAILRVAAMSMLQDDVAFAPYGWSHGLTLPQSVLGIISRLSNPTVATATAATYVVAFRAAQSSHDVDIDRLPDRTAITPADALDADPETAAGAVYHASDDELATIVGVVAARAASHPDAHVAKYTLACLDAADDDPSQRRLYLAAAAYLGAWWANQP